MSFLEGFDWLMLITIGISSVFLLYLTGSLEFIPPILAIVVSSVMIASRKVRGAVRSEYEDTGPMTIQDFKDIDPKVLGMVKGDVEFRQWPDYCHKCDSELGEVELRGKMVIERNESRRVIGLCKEDLGWIAPIIDHGTRPEKFEAHVKNSDNEKTQITQVRHNVSDD